MSSTGEPKGRPDAEPKLTPHVLAQVDQLEVQAKFHHGLVEQIIAAVELGDSTPTLDPADEYFGFLD